jgi:deoxyadenosine/deoxycytidine kinase
MGRVKRSSTYENRPIDLDVLFFNYEIFSDENLSIPHKHLHTRDFVLFPLNDIAADFIHPIIKKSVKELKYALPPTEIQVVEETLNLPSLPATDLRYICIEGNIGAGKTTFAQMFSQDYKAKQILERFKDNPFLPQFYKDPKRFAFPTEMSFLADRHQQLVEDIAQLDLFSSLCVADYDLYKSLIFAEITLQPEEFQLYKKIFNIIYKEIPKPDLYIYFYQNTENLLKNIIKRGRPYEQNISIDYLEKINEGYLNYIKQQTKFKTKLVDISDKNFVDNRSDYLDIIEEILN